MPAVRSTCARAVSQAAAPRQPRTRSAWRAALLAVLERELGAALRGLPLLCWCRWLVAGWLGQPWFNTQRRGPACRRGASSRSSWTLTFRQRRCRSTCRVRCTALRLRSPAAHPSSCRAAAGTHPFCHFCRRNFYDDDALWSHMHQAHFSCQVCPPAATAHAYFHTAQDLLRHMRCVRTYWFELPGGGCGNMHQGKARQGRTLDSPLFGMLQRRALCMRRSGVRRLLCCFCYVGCAGWDDAWGPVLLDERARSCPCQCA